MEQDFTYRQRCRQERLELKRMQTFRRKIRMLTTVCTFTFLVITIISTNSIIANAGQGYEKEYQKLYKSFVVESGETVWKIASENMNIGFHSINELVEEISFINGLDDVYTIKTGSVLIIPYYGEV